MTEGNHCLVAVGNNEGESKVVERTPQLSGLIPFPNSTTHISTYRFNPESDLRVDPEYNEYHSKSLSERSNSSLPLPCSSFTYSTTGITESFNGGEGSRLFEHGFKRQVNRSEEMAFTLENAEVVRHEESGDDESQTSPGGSEPLPITSNVSTEKKGKASSSSDTFTRLAEKPWDALRIPFRDIQHTVVGSQMPEIRDEPSMGLFIGQLPRSYTSDDVKLLLMALAYQGDKKLQPVEVRYVKPHDRGRTCAFVMVNAGAIPLLLPFNRRVLCDVHSLWVVSSAMASYLPGFIETVPPRLLRHLPKAPLVVENLVPQMKRHVKSTQSLTAQDPPPGGGYDGVGQQKSRERGQANENIWISCASSFPAMPGFIPGMQQPSVPMVFSSPPMLTPYSGEARGPNGVLLADSHGSFARQSEMCPTGGPSSFPPQAFTDSSTLSYFSTSGTAVPSSAQGLTDVTNGEPVYIMPLPAPPQPSPSTSYQTYYQRYNAPPVNMDQGGGYQRQRM